MAQILTLVSEGGSIYVQKNPSQHTSVVNFDAELM